MATTLTCLQPCQKDQPLSFFRNPPVSFHVQRDSRVILRASVLHTPALLNKGQATAREAPAKNELARRTAEKLKTGYWGGGWIRSCVKCLCKLSARMQSNL